MKKLLIFSMLFTLSFVLFGQTNKDKEIISEGKEAEKSLLELDKGMDNFFNSAYGYVIFPNVGKGGLGVGGASGNGAVYKQGKLVGMAKLSQVSIGFQAGGQSFRGNCIF